LKLHSHFAFASPKSFFRVVEVFLEYKEATRPQAIYQTANKNQFFLDIITKD
jgi:hypothetical protein